ncbi:acyl carrier protein [Streptomyces sp. WAC05374]|uniref:acyl carrier protein n=1 Tax=unclassified Streptomyces TaxID=2593676 RepID=UPI000F87CC50|nr:acyl carrier protein [Streptomyces sp. WAC05374]RST18201.1 acyl carrier protein [Streptomyces sp. WAC05374]TDF43936.1 acyl carrier protein [Streptomyces sp. WAC05374]TDF52127.1 acyl carrier protein [Streptomyces sp. WAC05374]TDF54482.1 acyl carrier protein [Streptomyces sp. WAC05374]
MTTANRVDADGRATIKEIICDILEIDAEEMTDTSRFKEDHEADSMGAIEILSQLERAFGIDIDQAELARMVNLEGVVTVVDEAVAAKAASH